MSGEALAESLALVMYMAAAREDATPEQREQLKMVLVQLGPLYKAGQVQPEAWRRAVQKIMGQAWRPSQKWRQGFWADRIDG